MKKMKEGHTMRVMKTLTVLSEYKASVKAVKMMSYDVGVRLDVRKWGTTKDAAYSGISMTREEAKALRAYLDSADIDALFDEAEKTIADEKAHPFED